MGNGCSTAVQHVREPMPRPEPSSPRSVAGDPLEFATLPIETTQDMQIGQFFIREEPASAEKETKYANMVANYRAATRRGAEKQMMTASGKPVKRSKTPIVRTHSDLALLAAANEEKESKNAFRKLLKEGPPMKKRWQLWKAASDSAYYYKPHVYDKLLKVKNQKLEYEIMKDINRTFPELTYFQQQVAKGDKPDGEGAPLIDRGDRDVSNLPAGVPLGQEQLFRVLKALGVYIPKVGYVQGMNFFVGFILVVAGGSEVEAFWFTVSLLLQPKFTLMASLLHEFPGIHVLCKAFWSIFPSKLPKIATTFTNENVPDLMWLTKWFLTWFVHTLPMPEVLRVWDFLLLDGSIGLLKVAIALLKSLQSHLAGKDIIDIMQVMNSLRHTNPQFSRPSIEEVLKSAAEIKIADDVLNKAITEYLASPDGAKQSDDVKTVLLQAFKSAAPRGQHGFSEPSDQFMLIEEHLHSLMKPVEPIGPIEIERPKTRELVPSMIVISANQSKKSLQILPNDQQQDQKIQLNTEDVKQSTELDTGLVNDVGIVSPAH